jgi:hypothetical protein
MRYNGPTKVRITYPGVPIHAAASAADVAAEQEGRYRQAHRMPGPVLVSGKEYSDWSEQERRDAWMWQLGPRYQAGLKPLPTPE